MKKYKVKLTSEEVSDLKIKKHQIKKPSKLSQNLFKEWKNITRYD